MVEPVESLTKQLVQRITDPFGLAILAGVTSSSFWFFGNFGMALDGIVPAVSTEKERGKKDVTDVSALRLWEWFYNRGKASVYYSLPFAFSRTMWAYNKPAFYVLQKHFGVVALLGGTSYLVASTFRPDLRPILYGASFFLYSVIPYTLIVCEYYHTPFTQTTPS